jgi:predicted nucleic acid-binding protein
MSLTSDPSPLGEVFVLDSWIFLERALKGIRVQRLDVLIERAAASQATLLLNEMNLGEIFYMISKQKGEAVAETAVRSIMKLPIAVVPVLSGDVMNAAKLKAGTTLSYADCFCAVLALRFGATVVTGDPDFLKLQQSGLLRVDWVGA